MYEVFVRELEFYGYHGIKDEEQNVGHRFKVDIDAEVEGTADQTDDINDTVSYTDLADLMIKIGTGQRFRTVEALAFRYCTDALAAFPMITAIQLEVSKPCPPIPAIAESTGVRYRLER